MKIAEVSQKYHVSPGTLRYYEREGLIPPVPKNKSGARDYDAVSCNWVELITCFRKAGIGIEAMKKYATYLQQEKYDDECKSLLLEEQKRIQQTISEMETSLSFLTQILDTWEQGIDILKRDFSLSNK